MPTSVNAIGRSGSGRPRAASRTSAGISAPAATVSTMDPGNRGLTSRRAAFPVRSTRAWTLATPTTPTAWATAAPNASSSGSRWVRPATATPESTFRRDRGTEARTCPSGPTSTSMEYSAPGRYSWITSSPERGTEASVWRSRCTRTSRDPLPVRGLVTRGRSHAPRFNPGPRISVRGTGTTPVHRRTSAALSKQVCNVSTPATTNWAPTAPRSARRTARGSSSASTVGTTMSTPSATQRSMTWSTNAGSSPRRNRNRSPGGTR